MSDQITPMNIAVTTTPRNCMIAAAIAHCEGYFSVKSIAFRQNNPGNIRATPLSYKTYVSKQTGWSALLADIHANEGKTLREFITKYAPPSENNTDVYLNVMVLLTGIQPDDAI